MTSIAIFPCSYTKGATIIGELINSLHMPVYKDEKVSSWTNLLFHRQAYDRSLYDVVFPIKNKNIINITTNIIDQFKDVKSSEPRFQAYAALPVQENHGYMGDQLGWMG